MPIDNVMNDRSSTCVQTHQPVNKKPKKSIIMDDGSQRTVKLVSSNFGNTTFQCSSRRHNTQNSYPPRNVIHSQAGYRSVTNRNAFETIEISNLGKKSLTTPKEICRDFRFLHDTQNNRGFGLCDVLVYCIRETFGMSDFESCFMSFDNYVNLTEQKLSEIYISQNTWSFKDQKKSLLATVLVHNVILNLQIDRLPSLEGRVNPVNLIKEMWKGLYLEHGAEFLKIVLSESKELMKCLPEQRDVCFDGYTIPAGYSELTVIIKEMTCPVESELFEKSKLPNFFKELKKAVTKDDFNRVLDIDANLINL